ncbi:hypothetical protein CVT24_005885 [Panaeolus cyanescens]|uniref:Protein kinase domain-containing protein n=1 Tax=Panaeolus cyanescens TaxID=181874 RepID=A0A409YEV9_9AGAR|nr:hypothetical protein CVT24_005885 [Panaeolus cyanescens]
MCIKLGVICNLTPLNIASFTTYYSILVTFYSSLWFSRIALLFSLIRVAPERHQRVMYGIFALFLSIYILLVGQSVWVCNTQRKTSSACMPNQQMAIFEIIGDAFADLTLVGLSYNLFTIIQERALRFRLMSIFSTCIGTTVVSLIHGIFILEAGVNLDVLLIAIVEATVSTIVANIPVLSTFFINLFPSLRFPSEHSQPNSISSLRVSGLSLRITRDSSAYGPPPNPSSRHSHSHSHSHSVSHSHSNPYAHLGNGRRMSSQARSQTRRTSGSAIIFERPPSAPSHPDFEWNDRRPGDHALISTRRETHFEMDLEFASQRTSSPDLKYDANADIAEATIQELFASAADEDKIEQYLTQSKFYNKDWKKLKLRVKNEKDLYTPLLAIVQDILRVKTEYLDGDELLSSPTFLVTGTGPQFRCQDHEKAWRCCASFIDAKTDNWVLHNLQDLKAEWEEELAAYARQCFIAHPTRIFVYGLCITETKLRLYRYDRCGILYSEWMNYRKKNAHQLVRAILLISSSDPAKLGFDETVVINEDGKHVFFMQQEGQEGQPVKFTEVRLEWNCVSLSGRSTMCWKVIDEDTKKTYLLKQQFVDARQVPEHELLKAVKGIKGIVKVHCAQRIGEPMSKLRGTLPEGFQDRFLYRMVVEEYGQSMKYVTDVVLLLKALRDAITAHKEAYIDRHVLYRDISANNILYAKDPTKLRQGEGYGNLIDFELSININQTNSLYRKDFRAGTHSFHSVSLLRSEAKSRDYDRDYLDDLQAFFWVLIWILIKMLPPIEGVACKSTDESQLKSLEVFEAEPPIAADRKQVWLTNCFDGDSCEFLSLEWGPEILMFVEQLGSSFYRHEVAKKKLRNPFTSAVRAKLRPSTIRQKAPTPSEEYDKVVALFENVIRQLESTQRSFRTPQPRSPRSPKSPRPPHSPPPTQSRIVPQATPTKEGTSSKPGASFRSNKELRPALRKEMEGMAHYFEEKDVKNLFDNAAEDIKITEYLKQCKYYKKDWKKLPHSVNPENRLYSPLLDIFRDILRYFYPKQDRRAHHLRKNSKLKIEDGDELATSPDFVVTGSGPQFRRQDHEKAWRCCASFIEAKRNNWISTKGELRAEWYDQLASYARQCFIAHPIRIFVYGLCITETRFRLYRYDRCGLLYSQWMDYRGENAGQLVRALLIISSSDPAMLGFDETVVINKDGKHVFSMEQEGEPVKLTEVSLEWDCLSLTGRSTTCWKVIDEATKETFLLKQQFVNAHRTPEHELLEAVKGIKGIVKVHFAQRIGKLMSELRGTIPKDFHDRFLYRMVVEEYGKSIKYVTDVVLLLKALRDAITAHKEAFIDRGVLHRDISANNILYAKDPTNLRNDEGFSNGTNPTSGIKMILMSFLWRQGTRLFHSVSLLRSEAKSRNYNQDYLDDLQAFFWVLIWILIKMLPPIDGVARKSTDKSQLESLEEFEARPSAAAHSKQAWLTNCFDGDACEFLSLEWGPEILKFVEQLGSLFYSHEKTKDKERRLGPVTTKKRKAPLTPSQNYDKVISLFDDVIKKLDKSKSTKSRTKGSKKRRRSSGQGDVERPQTPARTGSSSIPSTSSIPPAASSPVMSSPPRKRARRQMGPAA